MGGNRITGVAWPSSDTTDAATKGYVDLAVSTLSGGGSYVSKLGDTMSGQLVISKSSPVMLLSDTNSGYLRLISSGGVNYVQSGLIGVSGSSADLRFTDVFGASTWMTMKPGGNVGIGTTAPKQRGGLHLDYTGAGSFGFATSQGNFHASSNAYFDGAWKYIGATKASQILAKSDGGISFRATDTTGAADGAITWADTLLISSTGSVDFNGVVDLNNNYVTGVRWPSGTTDAATKGYVDSVTGNTCPGGFTEITANSRRLGCMQTDVDAGGTKTYDVANNYCFTSYGGRLPSVREYVIALSNYALSNENFFTWIGDPISTTDALGGNGVGSYTSQPFGSGFTYVRCFLP